VAVGDEGAVFHFGDHRCVRAERCGLDEAYGKPAADDALDHEELGPISPREWWMAARALTPVPVGLRSTSLSVCISMVVIIGQSSGGVQAVMVEGKVFGMEKVEFD